MIINNLNCSVINTKEIYIHDDILISLVFDKKAKKLTLNNKKFGSREKLYTITFKNTIGFTATSADFWLPGEYILDFECVDFNDKVLTKKIIEKQKAENPFFEENEYENYIETVLTFSSGDTIRVSCETIEIS